MDKQKSNYLINQNILDNNCKNPDTNTGDWYKDLRTICFSCCDENKTTIGCSQPELPQRVTATPTPTSTTTPTASLPYIRCPENLLQNSDFSNGINKSLILNNYLYYFNIGRVWPNNLIQNFQTNIDDKINCNVDLTIAEMWNNKFLFKNYQSTDINSSYTSDELFVDLCGSSNGPCGNISQTVELQDNYQYSITVDLGSNSSGDLLTERILRIYIKNTNNEIISSETFSVPANSMSMVLVEHIFSTAEAGDYTIVFDSASPIASNFGPVIGRPCLSPIGRKPDAPTPTPSPTSTVTPTASVTSTPQSSPTSTSTRTPSPTPTNTSTSSPTPTNTPTPSLSPAAAEIDLGNCWKWTDLVPASFTQTSDACITKTNRINEVKVYLSDSNIYSLSDSMSWVKEYTYPITYENHPSRIVSAITTNGITVLFTYFYNLANDSLGIRRSTDGGKTFVSTNFPTNKQYRSVKISENGDTVAALSNTVHVSRNLGQDVYSAENLPVTPWDTLGLSSNGQHMIVGCAEPSWNNGKPYKSTDYGQTWSRINEWGFGGIHLGTAISDDGQIMVVLTNQERSVYLSKDSGASWKEILRRTQTDGNQFIRSINMSRDGSTIVVSGDDFLAISKNYGDSFDELYDTSLGWYYSDCSFDGNFIIAYNSNVRKVAVYNCGAPLPPPLYMKF